MSNVASFIRHLARRAIRPAAYGHRGTLMSDDRPVTRVPGRTGAAAIAAHAQAARAAISPGIITAQLQRVLSEIRILRDDADVLAAIVRRLDNNQELMLDELRAMHVQQQRTAARLRTLEEGSM
jgi:hypothetical protein